MRQLHAAFAAQVAFLEPRAAAAEPQDSAAAGDIQLVVADGLEVQLPMAGAHRYPPTHASDHKCRGL